VTKVRAGIFGSIVMMLALAAGVFAYFGGNGTSPNVPGVAIGASGGAFTVSAAYTSTGSTTVIPGTGNMMFAVIVTNTATSSVNLDAVTATIEATGGNIYNQATSSVATGCLASWFTLTPSATWLIYGGQETLPHSLTANGGNAFTATGTIDLTMQESGTNQSVCEGVVPQISVSAS
jgi:hypothetical protein